MNDMMKNDITWCANADCPSKECLIRVKNCKAEPGELISIADFGGVCRFYIGWLVMHDESEGSK